MEISNGYKNDLIRRFRTPLFQEDEPPFYKIDHLIDDDEILAMAQINNEEMIEMVNQEVINKDAIRPLFYVNLNLYRLANHREISIPNKNVMLMIATTINYNIKKACRILGYGYYEEIAKIAGRR